MTDKLLGERVRDLLKAGVQVVVVQEADEILARAHVEQVAPKPVQVVSASNQEVQNILERHAESGEGTLVLLDFLAVYGGSEVAVRLVRQAALQQRENFAPGWVVLVEQPGTKIPPGCAGDVEILRSPLPTVDGLRKELDDFLSVTPDAEVTGNGETRFALAASMAGLPRHEASKLMSRCVVENAKKLDPGWLRREKAQRVTDRLGGALTFENADSVPDVGGLDLLKTWLDQRMGTFSSTKAREFGLPEPKGLLLLGTPGSGKSLTAKTVAKRAKLPLLRLDAGRLFGGLVGQSEMQTRQAIEAAEACAPCVLWIDEIEKGLAGSSGGGDSGTSARVFGAILTWLQDKTSPVFVVATANRINMLPPELLRKGRFDEIFYVGLPTKEEREEILQIHLTKRKRTLPSGSMLQLLGATDGFSGAELEQAIIDGMFTAYAANRDLEARDILAAIQATKPLSVTMKDEIRAIEAWARDRARPASSRRGLTTPDTVTPTEPGTFMGPRRPKLGDLN